MALLEWKSDFLSACTNANCLSFGTYTLKSGRISPYFFNAGLFHRADLLDSLSNAFAQTISSHKPSLSFDILFGPAYKGIPLAAATIKELAKLDRARFGSVSYSFNRKVAKTYGDGGNIVGAPLAGKRVMIIDDVMTAGTAVTECVEIIEREGGTVVGVVVALDRKEKMPTATDGDGVPGPSAIGEVKRKFGIDVMAVITLDDIMDNLKTRGDAADVKRLEEYRAKYRASD